jgi:hypothetical protein
MTDRLTEFSVKLPQLEEEPGRFRGGVKRFRLHKNEGSPAFILGGSNSEINHALNISNPIKSPSPFPSSVKSRDLSRDSLMFEGIKKIRSPVKLANNDPLHNNMLNLLSHPAFQQPTYTKQRPKIINNNPITGVSENISYSPEPIRRLINTGARMMSQDRHLLKY